MYKLDRFEKKKTIFSKTTSYVGEMPWGCIIGDNPAIVLNKDGSIQLTWRYRGPDLDSSTSTYLGMLTTQLNGALQNLDSDWTLYCEARRSAVDDYSEDVYFPDPVTKAIDEERKKNFQSGRFYRSSYYMTLCWMPPSDTEGKMKAAVVEGADKKKTTIEDYIETFQNVVEKIYYVFHDCDIPAEYLNKDEMLTYLHSCVSAKDYPMVMPDEKALLDEYLADMDLTGGLMPKLGNNCIAAVVPIKYVTKVSVFGFFDRLNRLSFPYRWVTRFFFMGKREALSLLNTKRRKWHSKAKPFTSMIWELLTGSVDNSKLDQGMLRKASEIQSAMEDVEADVMGYGFYSTAIILSDPDQSVVEERAKIVEGIFEDLSFVPKMEDLNAVDVFLACMPGNNNHQLRRPIISTGNLIHMLPISDVWAGDTVNKHLNGPPLIYTKTSGMTPFHFNLHVGDVGHTFIIGPTGAGKSVLLNCIEAQFRKYKNAKVFIFDKGESSRVLTEAVGGNFYDVAKETSTLSFQPLAYIDKTPEFLWAMEWLIDFITSQNVVVTPELRKKLHQALEYMQNREPQYRTLTTLVSNAGAIDKHLGLALRDLSLEGQYGGIFDANEDRLAMKVNSWQSFETETLMGIGGLVAPTLMYLFHRLMDQLDGSPTIIVLDECWKYLENPMFAEKINEWLKTLRKYNTSVIFATQSISDVTKSAIFETALDNCPSRIFLPNRNARENSETYKAFSLNDRQIDIISTSLPKRHYYYTGPYGNRLFDLELGPEALKYFAVSSDDTIACRKIVEKYGHQDFVKHWNEYRENGII